MNATWTAIGCLSIVVALLCITVVALAREIGVMSRRLPEAPALDTRVGPEIGDVLPLTHVTTIDGQNAAIGGPSAQRRVVVFLSPGCSPCTELARELPEVVRDWPTYGFAAVLSGATPAIEAFVPLLGSEIELILDAQGALLRAIGVSGTPFTLVLDANGRVTARGVANNREMMASLLRGHVRSGSASSWIPEGAEARG
jgi:methylamine dehydrogenase accessory protein MauD